MNKIKTAIVGYGRNGSNMHGATIAKDPAFEIVAVCDTDPARLEAARERHGCATYADYGKMLREESLDLVVIVSRSDQHCAMACEAMEAGSHVLVSKPWAVNGAEAARMVEVSRATGRKVLPWMPAHWGGDVRKIQELLAENAVGDVFQIVRTITCFAKRNDWQTELRYGGGYLLNWGAHLVYPALLLAGGDPVSVYSRLKLVLNPGDAEDQIFAVISMSGGVDVLVEHRMSPAPHPSWEILGTRGSIIVQGQTLRLIQNTPAEPSDPTQYRAMQASKVEESEYPVADPYGNAAEIYKDVAAEIQGCGSYAVTPEAALRLSCLFDSMRISQQTNQTVML